jgi:hypothetical protein
VDRGLGALGRAGGFGVGALVAGFSETAELALGAGSAEASGVAAGAAACVTEEGGDTLGGGAADWMSDVSALRCHRRPTPRPASTKTASTPATRLRGGGGGRVEGLTTSEAADPRVAVLATEGTDPLEGKGSRAMPTSGGLRTTPVEESPASGVKMPSTRRRSAAARTAVSSALFRPSARSTR